MKRGILMVGWCCILTMPFFVYADDENGGTIGTSMGFDFYSRIDDAGDSLAKSIVSRRVMDKRTFGALGCGAPWLKDERIDQRYLDQLVEGNYVSLIGIASEKGVTLNTESLSSLSQCLVEKYRDIQRGAYEDQNILETVGNIGLYTDGDTSNSDYDIVADIARINAIIFKEKYDYTGTKNYTAKSIANMLRGNPVSSIFPAQGSSGTSSGSTSSSGASTGTTGSGYSTASGSSHADTEIPSLPWTGVCRSTGGSGDTVANANDIFGDGFFDDLGSVLGGGGNNSGRVVYSTSPSTRDDPISASDTANFGNSEKSDFYHKTPCDGIFCITVEMKTGNMNLLGGFSNTSIESLLEKHSNMLDPISWSDLSAQKMTNNSYQLPFLNVKIANKIAGARVYMAESPQTTKRLKKEDTQAAKDALFDEAFRCAMNEAGLPGDPVLANGFIGAGYVNMQGQTTEDVSFSVKPLGAQEADNLNGCYQLRIGKSQKESYKSLSTDLNEIQGFTSAMLNSILEILDTDRKLDSLPSK